ncbi:MAG: hypothetical protein WBP41_01335 [Saprospiraceae bacterium]
MKSLASDRPSHYPADVHASSPWNGSEEKSSTCKSVDAFNFLMSIIQNERYVERNQGKLRSSDTELSNRESWQSDFYKDDYGIDENI